MKKKMLIFHPSLAPYRVDFFNYLNNHFDLIVCFLYDDVENQSFNQEQLKSESFFEIRYLTRGVSVLQRAMRIGIKAILKQEKPDIVICSEYDMPTLVSFFYRKMLRKRKYSLYTMCDDSLDKAKKRKGLRRFLRNYLSSNMDGVILHSKTVIDWYTLHISAKIKYFNVPIIHDEKKIRNILNNSLDLANSYISQYNLEGCKVILFVGRLVDIKNIPILIEAFCKLNDDNAVLAIVGDGDLRTDLQALTKQKGMDERVIFVGRKEREALYAWYMISQLFVFPSIYDSYGAVVNEALICGCPVICSELAGASDLITSHNGRVFDPYNVSELTQLLNEMIDCRRSIPSKITKIRDNEMPFLFDDVIGRIINQL